MSIKFFIDKFKYFHFIGIGGASMHLLAEYLLKKGKFISGSDLKTNDKIVHLRELGAKIYIGHKSKNIKDNVEVVVINGAIRKNNKELLRAKKMNIFIIDRAELLGVVSRDFEYVIAVAGTHGKTTTSSMLFYILKEYEKRTSCHIGGDVRDAKFCFGDKYLVVEACEYNKSFLSMHYDCAVVLNVEKDHVDSYGSFEKLQEGFETFLNKAKTKIIFGCDNTQFLKSNVDVFIENHATNVKINKNVCNFEFENEKYAMSVFGQHNVNNAVVAIAIAQKMGVPTAVIRRGLKKFVAVKRRAELIGELCGAPVISDFAHHPTEITCCLKAIKEKFNLPIVCVFQPHTFSRTKLLLNEFLSCFNLCEEVIVFKEYPARENCYDGISAKKLAILLKKRQHCTYVKNEHMCIDKLMSLSSKNKIIMLVGAGDMEAKIKNIIKAN